MKKSFKTAAIALCAVAGLSLSACGGGSSDNASAPEYNAEQVADYKPTPRDQVKDGGELKLPIAEVAEQQNPFQADSTLYSSDVWRLYNPQLALYTPEGEYSPNDDYLTDVKDEEVNGKTVVTYTIRDEAKFNDGTPIDWKAFENTWKFNRGDMEGVVPSSTDGYVLIESVKPGANDKQAVVTYNKVYPWWQGLFEFLLPPQVNSAELFNTGFLNKVHPEWGAGPYKLESIDFNTGNVTYVRNEKWWGEPGKLDKIVYRQMESMAATNAFKAGEIDATGASDKERYKVVKDMGDAADIRIGKAPSNFLLTLNAQAGPLKDDKVREAIMRAVDRKKLAEIQFNGMNYTEDAPGSFILFSSQKGYEDNFSDAVTYDPEGSKSLLDEAGWAADQGDFRAKDGEKLTLTYTLIGDNPTSKAMAGAIQQMLRGIGVDLQIRERPSSEFAKVSKERDFDLFMMGFTSGDPYGVAYFDQIYGSGSELNKSGTGSPEFDKKIEEMARISDPDKQIKKANELEKEAFKQHGIMPVFNGPVITAVKPGLVNYGPKMFGKIKPQDIGWAAE